MLWVPHPNQIVSLRDNGQENMGDVTDKTSRARFRLDSDRYVLCYVHARFVTLSGSGGNADMTLKLDHCDESGVYDFLLMTFENMGTSGVGFNPNLNFRLNAEELYQWVFRRDAVLVFEWTNPDSGNIRWALEVGLVDAT